jgi:hypothetical protein
MRIQATTIAAKCGVNYFNATSLKQLFGDGVGNVRRYVFLGDSTTRDSFHSFGNVFDYLCADHSSEEVQKTNTKDPRKCTTRVKRDPKHKNSIVSTAEFYPYGRKQGWKRSASKIYRQAMHGYVSQLAQQDVLIFNMGLHFDESATTQNSASFYSSVLSTLVRDLGLTGYSQKQRCLNLTDPYLPYVLWRETLPQHFNSSNGHYPLHILKSSERSVCVPLTASQRNGTSLSSASTSPCDPSCLPANWQNVMASSVMNELCVDTLPLWQDFSCLYNQHAASYGDCSHLTETGNIILIGRMLQHIFEKKHIHINITNCTNLDGDSATALFS